MERAPVTLLSALVKVTLSNTLSSSTVSSSMSTQGPSRFTTQMSSTPTITSYTRWSFMGDVLCPLPEPLQK